MHSITGVKFSANLLVRELKKVDDKDVIVEVQLEESKACYHLGNLSKVVSYLQSALFCLKGLNKRRFHKVAGVYRAFLRAVF